MNVETSREDILKQRLTDAFSPVVLTVINQSHLHAGHAGDNGSGESHFHLVIVSDAFQGVSRVARQQSVYKVINDLFLQGLHAVSMDTKTSVEHNK